MNSKGSSVLDLFFIVIFLFALAFVSIFGFMIFSNVNDGIQGSAVLPNDSKAIVQEQVDGYAQTWDNIFLIMFVGLGIATFIGAFFLQSHPVFFIFGVIVLLFVTIAAAIISNVYEEMVTASSISPYEASFTIMPFVFENYPIMIGSLGLLLLVGLFAKFRGDVS